MKELAPSKTPNMTMRRKEHPREDEQKSNLRQRPMYAKRAYRVRTRHKSTITEEIITSQE